MAARKKQMKSVDEALDTLETAARSSRKDLESSIGNQYQNLKEVFLSMKPGVQSYLTNVGGQASQALKKTTDSTTRIARQNAKRVDASARQRPWMFMGGAALLSGLLTFLFSRKGR